MVFLELAGNKMRRSEGLVGCWRRTLCCGDQEYVIFDSRVAGNDNEIDFEKVSVTNSNLGTRTSCGPCTPASNLIEEIVITVNGSFV